jgi:hypothetical protein
MVWILTRRRVVRWVCVRFGRDGVVVGVGACAGLGDDASAVEFADVSGSADCAVDCSGVGEIVGDGSASDAGLGGAGVVGGVGAAAASSIGVLLLQDMS